MNSQALKKAKLPDSPGVYFFLAGKKILYVGKATNLKERVRSYFSKDLIKTRGPLLVKMITEAKSIKFIETSSVLEALILEANEIKKHQPIYNTKEKDNTSFNYVVITNEDFPRVLVKRGRELNLEVGNLKPEAIFGPYPHGSELREALRIIRKIFPFRDKCTPNSGRPCFNAQIGLCPGVCSGRCSKKEYARIIRHLKLFFNGKKKLLIKSLEKEMKIFSKKQEFEEAEQIKKTIFALNHIQDVALIKNKKPEARSFNSEAVFRIEAYDIAHLSGQNTVGVMTVIEDGERKPADYRKFKIRGINGNVGVDDVANLKEIISRRLGHLEWALPNLIVVDGGLAQINAARQILKEKGFNIELASVVKDDKHKAREILMLKKNLNEHSHSILLANSEAHRFAINYHRKLRNQGLLI